MSAAIAAIGTAIIRATKIRNDFMTLQRGWMIELLDSY
jgi:hypothetical protein